MHPHKDLLVSCGEDRVWKMVGLPKGNVLLTGLGHTDWLSNCCFHPRSVHTALRASLISPGMHLFTLCLHSAVFFFFFSQKLLKFISNYGGSIGIQGVIFFTKTNSQFNPLQKEPPDLSRTQSMCFLPSASPEVVWERKLNDHLLIYFTHSLNSKYMLSKTARGVKNYITPGLVTMLGQKSELGESGKEGRF